MKPKFKCGDIISCESGNTWIVAQASDATGCYFGFNANSTYTLPYERQDNFKKIGEFPLQSIKDAIADAKRQSLDLQTQVNIAVNLMGKFLDADGMDTLLVLQDIRVDKNKNIVSVRCSDGISRPDKWMSVVDICEDYGVNKHGVR
jgi:hypothetical protein|nr:MAG TPA: hypothetical protein [Caudoviricetes sp.]